MIAGHRWEYEGDLLGYKCVGLPIGGVESHQWCIGCGCFIGDKELTILNTGKEFLNPTLDLLAFRKGFEPIESGTLKAYRKGYRA